MNISAITAAGYYKEMVSQVVEVGRNYEVVLSGFTFRNI